VFWIRQFNRAIHLFGEFEILWSKMTCLDEKVKRKLKLKNFKKVFQITKIEEFKIHYKKGNWNFNHFYSTYEGWAESTRYEGQVESAQGEGRAEST